MKYMPLFIDMHGRDILIIGGGKIALRRARQFVEAGARLTVIAPEICEEFHEFSEVTLLQRSVEINDVASHFFLVLIASNNTEVNTDIACACKKSGLLFNRCDDFREGNFINGSILARGEIISSTISGGVPAVSKFIQNKVSEIITPELVELARLLAELRPLIKASDIIAGSQQDFIASWVTEETLERLRDENPETLRQEILACL